jgi:hypothetical protein
MTLTRSASEGRPGTPSLALRVRMGMCHFLPSEVSAQKYAQEVRVCASPGIPAELDASNSRTRGCSDFSRIRVACGLSFENTGPGGASLGAAERSSQGGRSSATSRGAKNYAQKRNEQTWIVVGRCAREESGESRDEKDGGQVGNLRHGRQCRNFPAVSIFARNSFREIVRP